MNCTTIKNILLKENILIFDKKGYLRFKPPVISRFEEFINRDTSVSKEIKQYYLNNFKYFDEFSYRVRYEINERPKCSICGELLEWNNSSKEYYITCGKESCRIQQIQNTNIEKYGGIAPTCSKEVIEKRNKNNIIKYGCDPSQLASTKEKTKETFKRNWGEDHPLKTEKGKNLLKRTLNERYGVDHPIHIPGALEKREKTYIKNWGVNNPSKVAEIQLKKEETLMKHYNVKNPMHCKEIVDKMHKKYIYNNVYFDSQPELAFYIWLTDNKIDFIYHPEAEMWYTIVNSKGIIEKHKYLPDFLIGNVYYEIKGGHFFNEKGEPYYRVKKEFWWEKFNMMKENNVIILKSEDYKPYIRYVKEKFGPKFLKSCKVKK